MPLHLALSETHSGDEAVAYQRNSERHPRCVASFGTLAETAVERDRAWAAIGQRGVSRKGSFTFRVAACHSLPREALTGMLEQWAREGRVEPNAVAAWTRAGRVPEVGEPEEEIKNGPVCRVTTSADDHYEVRRQLRGLYTMDPDTYGWPPGVKESEPKATVVQRRIEMGLAHELTDAARERVVREWCEKNLRGTSWHACILAVEVPEHPREFVARVVYAQFKLERERDGAGEATNLWTFECKTSLPSPSPIVSTLWGNTPDGRRGRDALIENWRDSLASIQNQHLHKAGSRRRYFPEPYRGLRGPTGGAEEAPMVPGPDTTEGQDSTADAAWGTIGPPVLEIAGGRASGHQGGGHEVGHSIQILRVLTGMRAEEAARIRMMPEFWRLLDSQQASETPSAGIEWLWALQRAFCPCRPDEPWLKRWGEVQRDEPDEVMVGAAAASLVEQWTDMERKRYEYDPRPEVRALLCAARGWMARIERWRKQVATDAAENPASNGAEAEIERFVGLLEDRGIDLWQVGRTEDGKWLKGVAAQCRVRATVGEVVFEIRECTDEESISRVIDDWHSDHRADLQAMRDAGLRQPGEVSTAHEGTTTRNQWRGIEDAYGTEKAVACAKQFKSGVFHPVPENVFQAKWNALEPLDRMDVELRAEGRSETANKFRTWREHAERHVKQALDSSKEGLGNPGALDALLARQEFWRDFQRYEPRWAQRVIAAGARVSARRERVSKAGDAAGVTATAPEERARQAAVLTPTDAARLAGVDTGILRHDEPQVWAALQAPLRKFATVVRRRITRVAKAAGDGRAYAWWEDLVSPEELNVLEVIAPELALEVKGLHEKVQTRKEKFHSMLERMAKQIEAGGERRGMRRRQEKLARELTTEQALAVLTRAQWMRLARAGGLGAKGDWRAATDA